MGIKQLAFNDARVRIGILRKEFQSAFSVIYLRDEIADRQFGSDCSPQKALGKNIYEDVRIFMGYGGKFNLGTIGSHRLLRIA